MHEFSIAEALLERVRNHLPENTMLKSASIRTGLLRRIDPDALQMAWQALTQPGVMENSQLILQEVEGDDLILMSLEVDPIVDDLEVQHAGSGR